jgi:heme exporter protein A
MAESRPIIEIEALSKAYGFMPVLKEFSLTIERGQFVALLGPNGSGKSTLLKLLAGLSKPSSGTIRVGGWEIPKETEAVRAQIGMVSHKALLYDNLTARENLLFFARLYGLKDLTRIDKLLEQVGLAKRAHSLVRTFSRGMQQRLSIARALLHEPHVLLFDEPYTGLDQAASTVLDELLQAAHAEGHTILMTSHELDRAARLAERVLIISKGKLAFDGAAGMPAHEISALYTEVTGAATAR